MLKNDILYLLFLKYCRGLDFDEVRKYVQGDDIRNIDWKVTARVGKTHTKVFTEERERPVLLVVDQSSSMSIQSHSIFSALAVGFCSPLVNSRTDLYM